MGGIHRMYVSAYYAEILETKKQKEEKEVLFGVQSLFLQTKQPSSLEAFQK